MDLNKLSKVQAAILLLIAFIVSIVGLGGLSETYQDYYVAAALSRAFFTGILLLTLSSPFLYLFRKKSKKK